MSVSMHVLQAYLLSHFTPNIIILSTGQVSTEKAGNIKGIVALVSEHQASLLQYINTSSEPDVLISLKQCDVERNEFGSMQISIKAQTNLVNTYWQHKA